MVPEVWENVDPSRNPDPESNSDLCNEFSIVNVEILWFTFVLAMLSANEVGQLTVPQTPQALTFTYHRPQLRQKSTQVD